MSKLAAVRTGQPTQGMGGVTLFIRLPSLTTLNHQRSIHAPRIPLRLRR